MNETMIKTFQVMNVFEMFKKYEHVGPKNLKEMDQFIFMCKQDGYSELAEFFEEWKVAMHCYIDREHDAED